MRYADFRDRLEDALHEEGLFFRGADHRVETIDLSDTVRSWEMYVYRTATGCMEPFHVSAVIGFKWSPVDAARVVLGRGGSSHGARWPKETTASDRAQVDAVRPLAPCESPVWFDDVDPRAACVRRLDCRCCAEG